MQWKQSRLRCKDYVKLIKFERCRNFARKGRWSRIMRMCKIHNFIDILVVYEPDDLLLPLLAFVWSAYRPWSHTYWLFLDVLSTFLSLARALFVYGVEPANNFVLPRCKFNRWASLQKGTLWQLTIWRHLLELKKHLLIFPHVCKHEIHAANWLNLVPQVDFALDLGFTLGQLGLCLVSKFFFDFLWDLLIVHRF